MTTILNEASSVTQAEPRYQREARVAKDFGTLLHRVTTDTVENVDLCMIASAKKDAVRQGCIELIREVLELDPDIDLFDVMNLLNEGRLL